MHGISRRAGVTVAVIATAAASAMTAFIWLWMQPVTYDDLTPQQAADIRQLRADVGADNASLTSLNLSAGQMETALADLRGWYLTNASAWRASRQAVLDTESKIRALSSRHAQGDEQSAELTTLRTTLTARRAAYDALCVAARTAMDDLTVDDRAQMARMVAQADVALPFRCLELSEQQQADLKRLRARYHQSLVGKSQEERAQLATAHQTALTALLGSSNMTELAGMRASTTAASERALTASALVLATAGEAEPNAPTEEE